MLGIKIGGNCSIDKGVLILGNVSIGNNCGIGANAYIGTFGGGKVIIEDGCHIGNMNQIGSSGAKVTIGKNCLFAPNVMITDATHSFKEPTLIIKESPIFTDSVDIGSNVWLGTSVMVMKGVTIGSGAVVGAKSLVSKSIPSNAVAFGCPARVVYCRGESK